MGKHIVNAHVTVAGVDLSKHAASVDVGQPYDDHDVTGMGGKSHEHLSGLRDDTITINWWQDFDAASVDATLGEIHASQESAPVVVKPRDAAVSATNPSYTLEALLQNYSPLSGSAGEPSATETSFVCADGEGVVRDPAF